MSIGDEEANVDRAVAVMLAEAIITELQRRGGGQDLAEAIALNLRELGVPDALMLQRVMLAREWMRDLAGLLDDLERYFTVSARRT